MTAAEQAKQQQEQPLFFTHEQSKIGIYILIIMLTYKILLWCV